MSTESRGPVVEALVKAALDAIIVECTQQLHTGAPVTAGEVYSAIFTMALRAVTRARDAGEDVEALRSGIEKIWKEFPQENVS